LISEINSYGTFTDPMDSFTRENVGQTIIYQRCIPVLGDMTAAVIMDYPIDGSPVGMYQQVL